MRSDTDVLRAVEAELICHPDVDDTAIVVSVKDGVATLSGYVPNLLHKYRAEDAAKQTAERILTAGGTATPFDAKYLRSASASEV